MNKSFVKIGNFFKAKGPDILVVLGIGGVVGGTVMACKATKETSTILKEHTDKLSDIKTAKEVGLSDVNSGIPCTYDEKQYKKDITVTYLTTAGKFVKLYLPTALVMGTSITCLLGSHKMLNTRLAEVTAAHASLYAFNKNYRQNIIDEYGQEADTLASLGVKTNKSKDENGEETYTATDNFKVNSGYSRLFCKKYTALWEENELYNESFINNAQQWFNDMLDAKGVIFLNEVLEYFGFDTIQEGQVVGWFKDPNQVSKINFNAHKLLDNKNKYLDEDEQNGFLLTFNVDGNVMPYLLKNSQTIDSLVEA